MYSLPLLIGLAFADKKRCKSICAGVKIGQIERDKFRAPEAGIVGNGDQCTIAQPFGGRAVYFFEQSGADIGLFCLRPFALCIVLKAS